ncbi:MAG: DUF721 domain-containing protein [Nannocystaceae bacterium]|nr:DUF721 domain-containing protein [Nannocystaceae bacterium]
MARRRRNHGHAMPAAELAARAVASIVPAARLELLRLQLAWERALPPRLARVAVPVALDDRALVVNVVDSQWLHELTYLRADVLDRLREQGLGREIGSLRMRVGPVPVPEPPPPPPREAPAPVLPNQPASETLQAIAAVQDDVLRGAIATARQALTRFGRG